MLKCKVNKNLNMYYEILKKEVYKSFEKIYGQNASDIIKERMEKELFFIQNQNTSLGFLMAKKIVEKSESLGYFITTRGAVGASLVAYLLGITEINPLKAHYFCLKCKHVEFPVWELCGYDIENKLCPVCGEQFRKTGFDIPCEMFFGEKGEKCIDFTINMAPSIMDEIIDVMYDFCVDLLDEKELYELKKGCFRIRDEALKRIMSFDVVPCYEQEKLTELKRLTGVCPKSIPFDDKKTWDLINSQDSFGIAEIGAKFVMDIISLVKPICISDLMRISGLTHGTCTWIDNKRNLIEHHKLNELVSFRDDVFACFIDKGIKKDIAYKIFRKIYMGKGLDENEFLMLLESSIPEWYIDSFRTVAYLFPKAHCAECILTAYRIAFFKANYPDSYRLMFNKYADVCKS